MSNYKHSLDTVFALGATSMDDEAATRALVDFFDHETEQIRDWAARAVYERPLSDELRLRVAGYLTAPAGEATPLIDACAAKAALSIPPRTAKLHLAPALAAGGARAEAILRVIEEDLAARWRSGRHELSAELAALFLDIPEAGLVNNALQYFQGRGTAPNHKHVNLGEDSDAPFPFLIVGGLVENDTPVAGLYTFHHQYGGYACRQARLVGYGLNFGDSEELQRLRASCYQTHGHPMSESEISDWQLALGSSFPALDWGAEAMLVSKPCDPRSALCDARVLDFGGGVPWRTYLDMVEDPDVVIGSTFTEQHADALARLGPVRIAYLWGNSD